MKTFHDIKLKILCKPFYTVDADYLIITYYFTQQNGRDLDTRTKILLPYSTQELGWARASHSYFTNDLGVSVVGMQWGGDNTGYGAESVLVYSQRITEFFKSNIEIDFRAFWYGQRNDGNMELVIQAFKGGEMYQSGYEFFNTGGDLVSEIRRPYNVVTQQSSNIDGEYLDKMIFDRQRNMLYFQ